MIKDRINFFRDELGTQLLGNTVWVIPRQFWYELTDPRGTEGLLGLGDSRTKNLITTVVASSDYASLYANTQYR